MCSLIPSNVLTKYLLGILVFESGIIAKKHAETTSWYWQHFAIVDWDVIIETFWDCMLIVFCTKAKNANIKNGG